MSNLQFAPVPTRRIRPGEQRDVLWYTAKVLWDAAGASVAATCQMPAKRVHERVSARFPFAKPAHVYQAMRDLGRDRYVEVTSLPGTPAGNIFRMTERTRELVNDALNPLPGDEHIIKVEAAPAPAPVKPDPILTSLSTEQQAKIDRLYQLADDLLLAGDAARYKALYETEQARADLLNEEVEKVSKANANLILKIGQLRHTKDAKPAAETSMTLIRIADNKRQLQAIGRLLEALYSHGGGTAEVSPSVVRAIEKAGVSVSQLSCYTRIMFDLVGRG